MKREVFLFMTTILCPAAAMAGKSVIENASTLSLEGPSECSTSTSDENSVLTCSLVGEHEALKMEELAQVYRIDYFVDKSSSGRHVPVWSRDDEAATGGLSFYADRAVLSDGSPRRFFRHPENGVTDTGCPSYCTRSISVDSSKCALAGLACASRLGASAGIACANAYRWGIEYDKQACANMGCGPFMHP